MKDIYGYAKDYYSYRWDLVGGLQIKADPGSLDQLTSYWRDTRDKLDGILCDDEEGAGVTARTVRALVDEYHERVTKLADQCETNRSACSTMRERLTVARDNAVRAVEKAEEADTTLKACSAGLDTLDKDSDSYDRDKKHLESEQDLATALMSAAQAEYDLAVFSYNQSVQSFEASYQVPRYKQMIDYDGFGPLIVESGLTDHARDVGRSESELAPAPRAIKAFFHDATTIRDSRGNLDPAKVNDIGFTLAGAVQIGAPAFRANYKQKGLYEATKAGIYEVAEDQKKNRVYKTIRAAHNNELEFPTLSGLGEKLKGFTSKMLDKADNVLNKVVGYAHNADNYFGNKALPTPNWSGAKKLAKGVGSAVLKGAKSVPFLGAVASAGFSYKDYYDHDTTAQQAGASEKERRARATGAAAVDTAAGTAGSAVGTGVGAAIGTFFCPGLGTAIGGLAGGLIGGWIASEAADATGLKDWGAQKLGGLFK